MTPRNWTFDDAGLPGPGVQRHRHFDALLEKVRSLPALVTAVVRPEEANALSGAVLAAEEVIITPILIGRCPLIEAAASGLGLSLARFEIIEAAPGEAAARLACVPVHAGRAGAVVKGHLHTDELLRPMLDKVTGCGWAGGSPMSS